jgi:serine/threonine protein kinase
LQKLGHHQKIIAWELLDDGIKMPYMKNGGLSHYFKDHTPPQSATLRWIKDLGEAISYVHPHDVIVGDIASRNVLIGDDVSAKLSDFGDSHFVSFDEDIY